MSVVTRSYLQKGLKRLAKNQEFKTSKKNSDTIVFPSIPTLTKCQWFFSMCRIECSASNSDHALILCVKCSSWSAFHKHSEAYCQIQILG
jgi:hypothetical protein